jgi:hypothetical protein
VVDVRAWATGVLAFLAAWAVLYAVLSGWTAWAARGVKGVPESDAEETTEGAEG